MNQILPEKDKLYQPEIFQLVESLGVEKNWGPFHGLNLPVEEDMKKSHHVDFSDPFLLLLNIQ